MNVHCIRCRRAACRCGCGRDAIDADLLCLARMLHLRREAERLSPAYVAWIDAGRDGPEPLVRPEVRRTVRALLAETDRLASDAQPRASQG